MALPAIYPLAFLSAHLRIAQVPRVLVRHDETSTSGKGQYWAAQLAPPVWSFTLPLVARTAQAARAIDAKINALGTDRAMLFADPSYPGPAWGDLWRLRQATVTASAIQSDRKALRLSGLPAGYRLTVGDRISIAYGAGGASIWHGDILDDVTAVSGAATPMLEVNPPLPAGITTGAVVELVQPVIKAIVPSGGYTPFATIAGITTDAALQLMQKV